MKHLLFAYLLLIFGCSSTFSQEHRLEWSEMIPKSGYIIEMYPLQSKDFYTLTYKGGSIFGGYHFSKVDSFEIVNSQKISIAVNNNIANFEGGFVIDEHPCAFLTNTKDGIEYMYLQQYGYDLLPRGEAKLVAQYSVDKGQVKGPIQLIQSKDRKFFAVLWLVAGKKKDSDSYGFAVYNDQFELIDKGEYEVPFQSQYSEITDHLLSNNGAYFLVLKEFEPSEDKRMFRSYLQYRALHIYQVSSDGLEDYELPVPGKRVEAISINSDDDQLFTITGVYGENGVEGVKGMFYQKLNFVTKEIVDEGFEEFGKDFITEDWTERELERAERREEKGKGEPSLYSYVMRDAQIMDDGSIVGSLEQHYVLIRSSSDSRGVITTSYTYYYNDIIAFKIGKSGGFEWLQKIKKAQVSTNDGGPLSSYAFFVDSNSANFIFNDNIVNYDENGNYIPESAYLTKFTKKHNVVAMASVDLSNGNVKRNTVFSRKETGTLAVPKLFVTDFVKKQMLVYTTYRSKEKYGILYFK